MLVSVLNNLDLFNFFNNSNTHLKPPKMSTTNAQPSSSRSRYTKSAIANYPPVPALSYRQNGLEVLLGQKVNPSDYASFIFSPGFEQVYGQPTEYYSDFYLSLIH